MRFETNPLLVVASSLRDADAGIRKLHITGSCSVYGSIPFELIPQNELPITEDVDIITPVNTIEGWLIDKFGWASEFWDEHHLMIDPVDINTSILPPGWLGRMVSLPNDLGMEILCLDIYDACASKMAASREKDISFVTILLNHKLINMSELIKRVSLLDDRDFKKYERGIGMKTNKQAILKRLRSWNY